MKIISIPALLLLFSIASTAQINTMPELNFLKVSNTWEIYHPRVTNAFYAGIDTPRIHSRDTAKHDFYGDLVNDDSLYNKKYPLWEVALEVIAIDAGTVAMDRYILKADYARISLSSWKYNIQKGWEWDVDGFGINFFGHPYSGSLTYNAARSSGYGYSASVPFALAGSVMYEYFGENTRPSYNDVINTTIDGALLGEIFYRLSSDILDDTKRGGERVIREIGAGIIDPVRGLNRLFQGKSFRVTPHEVYAKEPVNYTLYAGVHNSYDGPSSKAQSLGLLNLQIDYGNPFEPRKRKPFDFFRMRMDLDYGKYKVLDNIGGYGILYGQNVQVGNTVSLVGGFQHYDYWHNPYFEMATAGFGLGVVTKFPLILNSNLYTSIHFAGVPLAANAIDYGLDTSSFRKYRYGGGFEAKVEATLNLGKFVSLSILAYYYRTHTYIGAPQNNTLTILRPRLAVRLYQQLSVGVENYTYMSTEGKDDVANLNVKLTRTEQKIFLLYFFENPKRYEHFN